MGIGRTKALSPQSQSNAEPAAPEVPTLSRCSYQPFPAEYRPWGPNSHETAVLVTHPTPLPQHLASTAPNRTKPVAGHHSESILSNQSNNPGCGEARTGGRCEGAGSLTPVSGCTRIFSMTSGSSIHAMMRTAPPHAGQISISIPNTRFSRCAHVIEACPSAGVGASAGDSSSLPLPCPPRITLAR